MSSLTNRRNDWFLNSTCLGCIAAILISLSLHAFGQAESDPWLIRANGEKGSINAHTTRQDLVKLYGASNVVDRDLADGEDTVPGTVLFPNDPQREIEILWKDPNIRSAPECAHIWGKRSRWHGVGGVTLGTSVSELERLNGRPFHLALTNDGTDMAQETISWRGGFLEKEFRGNGHIVLLIQGSPIEGVKPTGPSDFEVDSDSPAWRAQNPHITEITWIFASDVQR
jgi:hypothetical protein